MATRGKFTALTPEQALGRTTHHLRAGDALAAVQKSATPSAAAISGLSPNEAVTVRRGPAPRRAAAPGDSARQVPTNAERLTYLTKYNPAKMQRRDYEPFRAEVVSLVSATDFVSHHVDMNLMSHAAKFLGWVLRSQVPHTVRSVLTEQNIADYAAFLDGRREKSSSTAVGRLRLLMRGGRRAGTGARKPVRPPHTLQEARTFWETLDRIPQARAFEGRVLWVLTFGCGLTAEEAHAATSDWLVQDEHGPALRVVYSNGEFRRVPILDGKTVRVLQHAAAEAEAVLAEGAAGRGRNIARRSEPQAWLLSPQMLVRQDVITNLRTALGRVDGFWPHFDASRARFCWLISMLESPLPFSVVCRMAGMSPGNKSVTDLLAYMRTYSDADLRKQLRNLPNDAAKVVHFVPSTAALAAATRTEG